MRIKTCGWRSPKTLGQRSYGQFGGGWRRGKPRLRDEGTSGASSYMTHITNAASFEAYNRHEENPLLSAETLPESSSFLSFSAFASEYPDRFFALLSNLRPEFQELAIEYYKLHKSQAFIGRAHGFIQTRTWQALRIIEKALGALILLGPNPNASVLRPIIEKIGLETTPYGSLTKMVLVYASSQSYAIVAKEFGAPIPAIRKIFRPAINTLLAAKDVKAMAVGAYMHNLSHQASLTGAGLSKRCVARTKRVKTLRFSAPPADDSPLISFGAVVSLQDTPWCMLEISSDHRMAHISPMLRTYGKRLFGKKPAQIFAPINEDGELAFGYIFARSASSALVRGLTHVRGISEMATICNDEGVFVRAVTVPHAEVQEMINKHNPSPISRVRVNDFVEILTGAASKYCGTIITTDAEKLTVDVSFPTGRHFLVIADATCVKLLPNIPKTQRKFWGTALDGNS